MDKKTKQIKCLTLAEVQNMTSDDIIKHVHTEHKSAGVPIEDAWDAILDNVRKQIVNGMFKDDISPSDFKHTFAGDESFMNVAIAYIFTFGLIWIVFNNFMENKFNALQFTIVACGIASICITVLFLHLARKDEKKYVYAMRRLQNARSDHSRGVDQKLAR